MNKFTLTVIASLLVAISSIAVIAGPLSRGKYESAEYEVVREDGAFEVRKYPELVVASVTMDGTSKNEGSNSAFRRLFQYISGKNQSGEKIAMTTPVFMGSGEKKQGERMSFVVPAEIAKKGAPEAQDKSVVVSKRPAGKFAAYRYSGRWTDAREKAAREKLEAWLKKQGLSTAGGFERASYDSPFTIPALRRNEILVRIK